MAKQLDILPIPKWERSGSVSLSPNLLGDQSSRAHVIQTANASEHEATSVLSDQAAKEPAPQPEKRRKGRTGLKKKATVDRVDGRELRKVVAYFPSTVARRLLGFCAVEDVEISRYVVAAVEKALDRDGASKSST